jgi:hypothetical protein
VKFLRSIWLYLALILSSTVLLIIEYKTHIVFLHHLAAIPLEIMLGALLVERYLSRKERAEKVRKVLGDGIQKFLDYAIELKEKQPDIFFELMTDYEVSSRIAPNSPD